MIGMAELLDRVLRISATLQTDAVQTVTFRVISLNDRERRSILHHDGISANEGFKPDPAKLMHARVSADARTVGDLNVPGKRRRVCHDDIASELAVVSDVGLRHEEIVAADAGDAAAAGGAAMDSYKLANVVSLADLNCRRFTAVLEVLRCMADRDEWEYVRAAADRRTAVYRDVRIELDAVSKCYFIAYRAERSDETVRPDASVFTDDR